MEPNRFDTLSRALAAHGPRRGVLGLLASIPLVSGLLGILAPEETKAAGRRKRRKTRHKRRSGSDKKHRKGHHKKKPQCTPESVAQTCAGKCGSVSNNCQHAVDCGSCIAGCCASDGTCQDGTTNDACGSSGTCAVCTGQDQCQGQACTCVPDTCASLTACGPNIADGCGGTLSCGCGTGATPSCHQGVCASCAATCGNCYCANLTDGSTVCFSSAVGACNETCTTEADCSGGKLCVSTSTNSVDEQTESLPTLCNQTSPGICEIITRC